MYIIILDILILYLYILYIIILSVIYLLIKRKYTEMHPDLKMKITDFLQEM
jgi:hypothetical protein